jgi:hypothetical protein
MKQKPRGKTDEALISDISRLEANITVAKDDLVRVKSYWGANGGSYLSFIVRRGPANSVLQASKTSSNTSTGN